MNGRLDWKWIALGAAIMVAVNLAGALVLGLVLGPQLQQAASPEDVNLSGGQVALALAINVLSFFVGGFIVGIKSAGRTVLEPGISAVIAVLLVLLLSRQLTLVSLVVGGLVPFAAGVFGGWLGERSQKPRAT